LQQGTEPWAFHVNVGYMRNEYKLQADEDANRKDIWHVSIASQVKVVKDLSLVANLGMERNPDRLQHEPGFHSGRLFRLPNRPILDKEL
jgi:hypothetical protein